jgi:LysM repeat protein
MDRKKTIVAAVMINAGILTILFIAAMSMREEPEVPKVSKALAGNESLQKPLFKEVVEIPPAISEPAPFSLPPLAVHEEKVLPVLVLEAPLQVPVAADEIEVEKGDSLEKLAKKHLTSVDEIIKLNQLPSSFLKIGQRLKMPPQKSQVAAKMKSPPAIPSANPKTP